VCGRFNLIDSPEVQWLCEVLGINLQAKHLSQDKAPGANIAIVHVLDGERIVSDAIWWLFLKQESDQASPKPNYKYASFNSRSDKLFVKRSISYIPFRESRCLIPASAFVEGLGDKKTYHKIELEDSAIVFGGLYKEYLNRDTGEIVYGASIITLPPPEPKQQSQEQTQLSTKWNEIHPKSYPLMLDFEDTDLIEKWLDPGFAEVEDFQQLLVPRIIKPMKVTRIDKPSKWNPIEDSFMIR